MSRGCVLGVLILMVSACGSPPPSLPPPLPPTKVAFVVDLSQPPPSLPAWTPSFDERHIRGAVDDRPRALLANRDVPADDDGPAFALLHDGGARGHLTVDGVVGALPVAVTLDSAAGRTLVTRELVNTLGLTPSGAHVVRDINGVESNAAEVALPDLVVAGVRFTGLVALVGETALRDGLFLLGIDALRHVDVVYDGPNGAVALLPAGSALNDANVDDADIVAMDTTDRFVVQASAPGGDGPVTFELVVDTGSPLSAVSARVGVDGLLPADTSVTASLKGASGLANERRGRFWLRPLSLGLVQVGKVSALETGEAVGVVGTDVLGRGLVIISAARHALAFLPSKACSGDRLIDGVTVLSLRPQAVDGDFELTVKAPLSQTGTRFLLRSHDRQTGAPRGGAVEVTVGAGYRGRVETGLHFGSGPVSILVLPRTSASCLDVCMKLLGTWPSEQPPRSPDDSGGLYGPR